MDGGGDEGASSASSSLPCGSEEDAEDRNRWMIHCCASLREQESGWTPLSFVQKTGHYSRVQSSDCTENIESLKCKFPHSSFTAASGFKSFASEDRGFQKKIEGVQVHSVVSRTPRARTRATAAKPHENSKCIRRECVLRMCLKTHLLCVCVSDSCWG